ncbi:diacylglycerol/lipid kinase family protein [Planomicrobium okeanokoites]|uniref:Diacylglycerol/lipid kinase family protein n=1 Tax=Planomicrobium okeanokoites TaxID=244 RepID=A0ABV7KSW3_PLAOK|nr:diacylglycerol kinase family protein [Planomicrobium okeanokoites]TAA70751.1 diacylglycerol kinase family lipid kinase [Planomicrobium okeanokoites]
MRTIFIINPVAGNGKAMKKWMKFKETIEFPFELAVSQYSGHATELVRELQHSPEPVLVIGFGGDGTLREVIAGAAGSQQVLVGSIAAGSGNDFGRGFHSFKDAVEIADFVKNPAASRKDLGEFFDGRAYQFVSSTGIGFDAEISVKVNRSRIKHWLNKIGMGKLVYLVYVIITLLRFRLFRLTVEQEGEMLHFDKVWFATVSNQPYFGGGMKISPHSVPDDGVLELTVVNCLSRLKLLLVFGTVFSGKHLRFKEVHQIKGTRFSLSADQPVYRHVDGDSAGCTPEDRSIGYSVSASDWHSVNK